MPRNQQPRLSKQTDYLLTHYRKIGSPAILAATRHMSARHQAAHIEHSHYNQKTLTFMLSRNG